MPPNDDSAHDGPDGVTIASVLTQHLDRPGATMRSLAEAVGCHPNSIRNWRDGTSEPDDATLVRLLDAVAATPGERRDIWCSRMSIESLRLRSVVGAS